MNYTIEQAIQNAIEYLEAGGIRSGDIHDGLVGALAVLRNHPIGSVDVSGYLDA